MQALHQQEPAFIAAEPVIIDVHDMRVGQRAEDPDLAEGSQRGGFRRYRLARREERAAMAGQVPAGSA